MREALARSDNDFVLFDRAPARGKAQARGKRGAQRAGWLAVAVAAVFRRPLRTFGALVFLGIAGVVVVNAVALQNRSHPAPLFAGDRGGSLRQEGRVRAPESAPPVPVLPPARPSDLAPPAASPLQAEPAARPAPAAPAAPAAKAPGKDLIGDLIRSGAEPRAEAARSEGGRVLSAQRALAKLGYAIKPDGLMGAATRQAIERFEKDNGMPVTGELGPRVLKALATASGLPVE